MDKTESYEVGWGLGRIAFSVDCFTAKDGLLECKTRNEEAT